MKQNLLSITGILFLILLLFACDCMQGTGPVISETREIKPFNSIELDINAEVYLSNDTTYIMKIEAQENILSHLRTEVRGNRLEIDFDKGCFIDYKKVIIYLSTNKLEEIEINGSGNIIGKDVFNTEKIDIEIDGSGDVDLQLVSNKVGASISGSGDIILKGTAEKFRVDISGSGKVRAEELTTYKTDIDISGSGECYVYAHDYLDVSINGSGDVKYSGSPELRTHISGTGTVSKMER